MNEHLLTSLVAILALGVGGQWVAWRLHLPSILVLLTLGFIAGPVLRSVAPESSIHLDPEVVFGDLLFPLVSMSIAIILFEGGLSLRFRDLRDTGGVVWLLVTVGTVVTWLATAAAARAFVGMSWPLSLLLGAILTVSGPTVVLPLLRYIRPTGRVAPVLRWEAILIDPIGAMLAVLVFEAIIASETSTFSHAVLVLLQTAILGSLIGAAAGVVLLYLLSRYAVPDPLEKAVVLTVVVTAFSIANHFQSESGLFTVTVLGIVLGNQSWVRIKHLIEFKEDLRVLLVSSLFILLSARLSLGDLAQIRAGSFVFLGALILLVRPIAVLASTARSGFSWRERAFLAWLAPRGIVAAAVASLFAIRLSEHGHPQAELLAPLTFLSIVVTVAVYGLTAGRLARRLGLAESDPQGVLIIGAHRLGRAIAAVLQQQDYRVLLVDSNWAHVSQARLDGLPASYGNILAEESLLELNLGGIGKLLAMTPNDEVNTLSAIHFIEVFGRSNVYQLALEQTAGVRSQIISHDLRGRTLFNDEVTWERLDQRFAEGAEVKKTTLSTEFDFAAFQRRYNDKALVLFVMDEAGKLNVATTNVPVAPKPGHSLVFLAHDS